MSQSLIIDQKGLYTYGSPLSAPIGSLARGLNVNINRAGIIEPRKGFDQLVALPGANDRIRKIVFWSDSMLAHYGTTFAYYDAVTGYSSRGALSAPSNTPTIQTVNSQNKNLYLTSSIGLRKSDAIAGNIYAAGIPRGTIIEASLSGEGTAILTTKFVTYRYVIGKKDLNGNFQYGGVSGRFTLQNNSSPATVQNALVKCYLPAGLSPLNFIQLYRTVGFSSNATNDEMQQCYEQPLVEANITAGYIEITDVVPDNLLGGYIYTAPSQQGIANDNGVPPLSRDIAEYKTHMFFADIESIHRLTFSLISETVFAVGDTITLTMGGVPEVYTGYAAGGFNASLKRFVVDVAGATTSIKIDATIKSLIKCINLNATSSYYAYSLSTGDTDLPGKIMIEARSLGTASFTAVSNKPAAFQPQLSSPVNTNNTSSNDAFKNGLMYSKPNQNEAVPIKNILKVGSSDDRILRVMALREGLFIFKENDGAFVLRGDNETSFSVSLLDGTAKLIAPNSLVSINNLIYGLFTSGLCEVSDTGVNNFSLPIKDQILPLNGPLLTAVKNYAFAVGDDVNSKYVLSVPIVSTDVYCSVQIVFDTFNRTFTNWDVLVTAGALSPENGSLYFGMAAANNVYKQKNDNTHTDFADFGNTALLQSYVGTKLVFAPGFNVLAEIARGDVIDQGVNGFAYVEEVFDGYVIIDSPLEVDAWDVAVAVTIYKAIDTKIQWNPDVGGNAGAFKQYYECSLISKQNFQKEAKLYFSSDSNPSETPITIYSESGNGAFGQFDFGDGAFGGEQSSGPKRLGIPRSYARCSALSVRFEGKIAFSDYQIEGLSLSFNSLSTRTSR